MNRIYLDNNATTGVDPHVLEAMLVDLSLIPANPSAVHFFGQEAKQHLLFARQTIADFLKVKPSELIFTSGGTESLNTLLHSIKGHIITTNVEHSAVFNPIRLLESQSNPVTCVPVGSYGAAKPEQIEAAIRPDTRCIALTAVNNETGVKTDIESIAKIAKKADLFFIVDAVALLGKEPVTLFEGVSAMAFSGHKLHAPKGIGLTFLRAPHRIPPLLLGGDQEQGRRAGTENLSGILGLAAAIELLKTRQNDATQEMRRLRDRLERGLIDNLGNVLINGDGPRVVNTSNLSFAGVDGETLLLSLDLAGLAVSHGSACASGALEPSRVLLNMGYPRERVRSSLRFSLSRFTTEEEIDRTIDIITSIVRRLRK
jgi:cysteine desulfurase